MGLDDIHQMAQNDTPESVQVPRDMAGLITWAVGRFGAGALMAAVLGWFLTQVYNDAKATNERLLAAFQDNVRVNAQAATATAQTAAALEALRNEIHDAHNRANK